jgi:hypothetical protein
VTPDRQPYSVRPAFSGWAWAAHRWPMRATRATIFAVTGVALAIAAHRVAGGAVPDLRFSAAAVGVLLVIGLALSRRQCSGRVIGGLVVGTQLVLHAGLTFFGAGSGSGDQTALWTRLLFCHRPVQTITAADVTTARASLGLANVHLSSGGTPIASTPSLLSSLLSLPVLGMLAAHLVAAAVMAWWLTKGERFAWSLISRVVRAIRTLVVTRPLLASVGLRVAAAAPTAGPTRWSTPLVGRAPPNVSSAFLTALTV